MFKTPQTITLNGTRLELSDKTGTEKITGPKAGVTVNGGGNSRVFLVDPNVTASISGMTITGGNAGSDDGGGLDNFGTLTVSNSVFSSNSAFGGGGLYDESGATANGERQHLHQQLRLLPGRRRPRQLRDGDGKRQHLHRKLRRRRRRQLTTTVWRR